MAEAPIPSPIEYAPSPQHLAQLKQAQDLGKKVRRAATVAKVSGISIALFAALTLLTGFYDKATFLLGLAMAVIAIIELKGAAALKRLDLLAPQRLALNQIVFGIVLIAYACWQLWNNLQNPGSLASMPELKEAGLSDVGNLEQIINYAVFGGILLAALAGPGLTAIYYASRRKHLETYRQQTPEWIVQLQQAGMTI